jgi:hypothetical protein
MTTQTAMPPKLERGNWWSRNWKWFVPVVCVSALALFVAFVGLILTVVFGAIKSSDAYKIPVATAKADERVIGALGTPVEERLFVSGKIHVSGGAGEANLSIPLAGPQGKGTLYVEGTRSAGKWEFSMLVFEAKGERIDLKANGE